MRGREILLRIELPLALGLIFAGIRISVVFVVATATIAAIAGGGGLGEIIVDQASYRLAGVVAAALWVSALSLTAALAVDLARRLLTPKRSDGGIRLCSLAFRALTPRRGGST